MSRPLQIESTGRTTHQSHSGMEIIREFNVEPYVEHPRVLRALLGSITPQGTRIPPARDPYLPICYCAEARAELWHEDQLTTSKTLGKVEDDIVKILEGQKEAPDDGTAGAKIIATYRPLISAVTDPDSDKRWDWLDPRIVPAQSTVPWPGGLLVRAEGLVDTQLVKIPDDAATPIPITISDVSIRRILVAKPDWTTMAGMFNKINKETFPPPDHAAEGGLPKF